MTTAIIIPTYNNLEILTCCLETLIDYTDHEDYRIIVVNNGSTDGTIEYLEELKARSPVSLTIINLKENLGFIGGTNVGLNLLSDKEHALLLNDDTQITDRFWLGELEYTLESADDIGAVGPVSNVAAAMQDVIYSSQLPLVHENAMLVGFCLLIKSEARVKVGILDPRFGINMFDDFDYCIRLRDAGYRLMVDRQVFVFHRGHSTLNREPELFNARLRRGEELLIDKWGYEKWIKYSREWPPSVKEWIDNKLVKVTVKEPEAEQPEVEEPETPWDAAYEILEPLATDDYIGGAWPEVRREKCKAMFELATQSDGNIIELGTYRGLGAIALALGTEHKVYTIDDWSPKIDLHGVQYDRNDYVLFSQNIESLDEKVAGRIVSLSADAVQVNKAAFKQIGLVFWDLGNGQIKEAFESWSGVMPQGSIFAVKDDGTLDRNWFYSRPGWERYDEYPEGLVFAIKKVEVKLVGTALWICDGEPYAKEAAVSAASVSAKMPGLDLKIVSATRKHEEWFVDSTQNLCQVLDHLPEGEKVLWLDTDTYMVEPVYDLFDALDEYDLVLAHAPGHWTAPTVEPIPACYPEFNIGVIAMKNNRTARALWADVYLRQVEFVGVYGNNDQAALREVLYHNQSVDYFVMPCEYDFRFHFGGQLRDKVKILHGHLGGGLDDYGKIATSINRLYAEGYQLPPRIWTLQEMAGLT